MVQKRQMTADERQCIYDLAASGHTLAQIAREVGYSRYAVKELLHKQFGATANGAVWTENEDRVLRSAATDGLSTRETAIKLHRTMSAVQRRAYTIGIRFSSQENLDTKPLSSTAAARAYEAVAHKLERLRNENLNIPRGVPVYIPTLTVQRSSSSICTDASFGGAERVRVMRAA